MPRWLALSLLGLSLLASSSTPSPSKDAGGGERPELVVLGTGSVEGYVDRCGCPTNPMGGLDKRGGYLTGLRRFWPGSSLLVLDVGDFSDAPSPGGRVRTKALIEGMSRLGYGAIGLGSRELRFGVDEVLDTARAFALPVVASNLLAVQSGSPLALRSITLRSGALRVAVAAVMRHDPALAASSARLGPLATEAPVTSLQQLLPELRAQHDLVVVLAAMPIEEAMQIAERVPGIDLILGAHGGYSTERVERVGTTRIMYLSDQGKAFGQVEYYRGRDGQWLVESRLAGLGAAIKPDEGLTSFTLAALQAAQEADVAQLQPRPPDQPSARFLGAGACTSCHAGLVNHWAKTRHAAAWKTLERAEGGEPKRAECFACHVVGAGIASGFESPRATPHLLGVGCEACHGPGSIHRDQPALPYGKTALATCTACHTAETDPGFDYYSARQRIAHPVSP